jgi:hypothetical protein
MNNDKPFTDPQLDGHERFRVSQRNFGVSSDTAKTPIESPNSENFNTAKTPNSENFNTVKTSIENHVEIPNESLLTPCIDIKKTISRLKKFKEMYHLFRIRNDEIRSSMPKTGCRMFSMP